MRASKKQTCYTLCTFAFESAYTSSTLPLPLDKSVKKNRHVNYKRESTRFVIQIADNKRGTFFVRGKNKQMPNF